MGGKTERENEREKTKEKEGRERGKRMIEAVRLKVMERVRKINMKKGGTKIDINIHTYRQTDRNMWRQKMKVWPMDDISLLVDLKS